MLCIGRGDVRVKDTQTTGKTCLFIIKNFLDLRSSDKCIPKATQMVFRMLFQNVILN